MPDGERAGAQKWCIITSEYPPKGGGVSDHTYQLASALAAAGDLVQVWTPRAAGPPTPAPGVDVHLLPSRFRLDTLRIIARVIREQPKDTRILVQYVPTSFGWRMMNLPIALLLYVKRRRPIEVYFHEMGFPISGGQRWRRNIAGAVHLLMNWLVARAASRVFVAIPDWAPRLESFRSAPDLPRAPIVWVPISSNVPTQVDPAHVAAIRDANLPDDAHSLIGHFGTYGRYHGGVLIEAFERILDDDATRHVLLVGRNSVSFRTAFVAKRPDLAERITATGGVDAARVSAYLSACDVLLQPFEDGVSARRSSLMAGLALGCPIVTNRGEMTASVWMDRGAVCLADSDDPRDLAANVTVLLGNAELRQATGREARATHEELFAIGHCVAQLRAAAHFVARSDAPAIRSAAYPRVLMLHMTLPTRGRKPGGVEVTVHRLANALVDLGVPVTVGSLSSPPPDARYAYRSLFAQMQWLYDSHVGRLVALPLLFNFASVRGADVVHYHGDDWFSLDRSYPSVRTLHGSALREAQRATRWQRRLAQNIIYPLERLSRRLATVAVAVGRDTASLHDVHRVIGNGVDGSVFHPGEKSEVPSLLYVGLWNGRKRGRWMYETFVESIATAHPSVRLHFIADVEPPPHPRVVFDRFPDDERLARAYREAWAFVLPSTYEGFGIPYLEAMASGTAVVATPNTGAMELLGAGACGILAEDDAFAPAVLELLRDDATRSRLERAGVERSRAYQWSSIAGAYLEVYRDAVVRYGNAVRGE